MPSSPGPDEGAQAGDSPASLPPTQYTSCPPEEERLPHTDQPEGFDAEIAEAIAPSSNEGAGEESERSESTVHGAADSKHVEMSDATTSTASQDSTDHEVRLAQSLSTSTPPPPALTPAWPLSVPQSYRIRPNSSSSCLRPGSKFVGTQQSDRQVYAVQVELKYVDMEESFLCGYLRIQGLTDDHPTLTTYFEGEIIGNRYTFKTEHPEWGSSEKVDMQHWNRFPAWRPLSKQAKSPGFSFTNFAQREHLFMRWKEYFLVPDHKVKTISGASFEGFYYICFNQCTGAVSGIYFHAKSEKYQQLELEHVNDRGCTGAVEFR